MLQSLIAFDGVLLGFAAIVFNSLMNRESTFERISYLFSSMFATVILFLLSVTAAFFALASVSSTGLAAGSFVQPLGFMVYGTSVLFFTIYIHVARSRQAFNRAAGAIERHGWSVEFVPFCRLRRRESVERLK